MQNNETSSQSITSCVLFFFKSSFVRDQSRMTTVQKDTEKFSIVEGKITTITTLLVVLFHWIVKGGPFKLQFKFLISPR